MAEFDLQFAHFKSCFRSLIRDQENKNANSIITVRKKKGYSHLSAPCCYVNCWEAINSRCASLQTSDINLTVHNYCNGLFLLANEELVPPAYHVYNPATNQCVTLRDPPLTKPHEYRKSALAFDPRKTSHFKVLRFSSRNRTTPEKLHKTCVDIYSSKERRWTHCNLLSEGRILIVPGFVRNNRYFIFVNGVLYLMLVDHDSLFLFDVEKLHGRIIELPEGKHIESCIGKSENRLFYGTYNYKDSQLKISMLQNYETGEWLLKHTGYGENVEKHPVAVNPNRKFRFYMRPYAFHPDVEVLFCWIEGKIVSYHFGSKKNDNERLEEICNIGDYTISLAVPYARFLSHLD